MLTPEYLQNLSNEITSLYDSLNEFTINDIARRIAKTNSITDSAAWQINMLQNAGMHRDAVEKEVARLLNETEAKVYQMFEDAGVTTLEYDDVIYRKAGKNPVPLYLNKRLMTILTVEASKTFGTFKNLISTTAKQSEKLFIDTCSAAYLQVSSGILDYNSAIRNAVNTISKKSATVKYPSGHVDKIDVAARRCILTGVNQTAAKVQIEHAFEMGCDLMEISAHSGARPDHASWQGKIVSLSGRPGYLSLLDIGYGEVTGFMGANCRHSWSPYFEGISKPVYTNAQLEEFKNETVTYNDEVIPKWKAIEKQRYYERSIRETRRSLSALDGAIKGTADKEALKKLEQDFTAFSVKLKKQEAKLKDLCKQTGLLIDNSRVQTYNFGKSVSSKASAHAQRHYDIWRKSIGADDTPKTLANYYKMKYNDKKEYELLQAYIKSVDKGMIKPLTSYSYYKKIVNEIDEKLVGITTSNGIKITGQAKHFAERVIGGERKSQKEIEKHPERDWHRKGVSVDEIKDNLQNGYTNGKVDIDKLGRESISYTNNICRVSVNPNTGELIQVNPVSLRK